jgi:hypothetical protein
LIQVNAADGGAGGELIGWRPPKIRGERQDDERDDNEQTSPGFRNDRRTR